MLKKENIKGSPKSTAVGALLVVATVVGFFAFNEVDITQMLIGVVARAAFLGIKDPRTK